MKERVQRCFNKGAVNYDSAAIVQARVAQALAKRIPTMTPKTILEIGCGTGLFSQKIISSFPNASIQLTDIAPAMIEICKTRFKKFSNVDTICIDGEGLHQIDCSYDLISSSMTLHWFTEFKKSFSDIINRLTPSGQFIFAMLGKNSLNEWREICTTYQFPIPMPLLPSVETLKNHFPLMEIHVENMHQSYKSILEFLRTLKKLGAVATPDFYSPLSAGKLRRLLRYFNKEINMTYEIIYGIYKK